MEFLQTYGKEIVSILVPFIAFGINRIFRAKAKLFLSNPHSFTFLVQEPLYDAEGKLIKQVQTVRTASYMLKNGGSEPAKNVELVFNWKPLCINVWPARHVVEHIEPDKRCVLIFDSLAPAEIVGFELFSVNNELPDLITARSDQCVAKHINMYPQPVAKGWQVKVIGTMALAGAAVTLYVLLVLLQFLMLRTPLSY